MIAGSFQHVRPCALAGRYQCSSNHAFSKQVFLRLAAACKCSDSEALVARFRPSHGVLQVFQSLLEIVPATDGYHHYQRPSALSDKERILTESSELFSNSITHLGLRYHLRCRG